MSTDVNVNMISQHNNVRVVRHCNITYNYWARLATLSYALLQINNESVVGNHLTETVDTTNLIQDRIINCRLIMFH